MAFTVINSDQKQSISLSEEAWITVRQDMAAFGCEKYSGFFNRVILNYYEDADATLSRTWQRKREEFCQDLTEPPVGADFRGQARSSGKDLAMAQRKNAAEILADNAVRRLKADVIDCYPKGPGVKFRINNELFQYLTESSECREDEAYCDYIGRYLKAILEEYARLPYYRRERIYYAQWFTDIENAIATRRRLQITTSAGKDYVVKPYRILTDSQTKYHYLVAWHDETEKAWPFRISHIRQLKQRRSSGKITEKEKTCIEEALQQKDVPFMGEETCTIRVRLTEEGIRKYASILHMRPRYETVEGENGDVYVFRSTVRQVRYYFERFGADARILEPAELAQQMRQWHLDAARQYE